MAEYEKKSKRDQFLEIALSPIGSLSLRERLEKDKVLLESAFKILSPCTVDLTLSASGYRIVECFLKANDDGINTVLSESLSREWNELERVMNTVKGRFICETLLSREVKSFAHTLISTTPKEWWFKNTDSLPILIKALNSSEIDVIKEFISNGKTEVDLCDTPEGLYCVLKVRQNSEGQPGWRTELKKLILLKVKSVAGSEALVQVVVYGDVFAKDIIEIIVCRRESFDDSTTVSFMIRLISLSSVQMRQIIFNCLCVPESNPIVCQIRFTDRFDEFKNVCDSHFTAAQRERLDKYLESTPIESVVDECLNAVDTTDEQPMAMETATVDDEKKKKRKIDLSNESPDSASKKPREEVTDRLPPSSSIITSPPSTSTAILPLPPQSIHSTVLESSQSTVSTAVSVPPPVPVPAPNAEVSVPVPSSDTVTSSPAEVFGPAPPPSVPVAPPVEDTVPPPATVSSSSTTVVTAVSSSMNLAKKVKSVVKGGARVSVREKRRVSSDNAAVATPSTSVSKSTIPTPQTVERICEILRENIDPGEHMLYMAMGPKYGKIIKKLEAPSEKDTYNEFPNSCFSFIEKGLLALMMHERGTQVVLWFINNGTFVHKGTIENVVRETVNDLVESGEYGRTIVKAVISNCLDPNKKKELSEKLLHAMLRNQDFPAASVDESNDTDDVAITHEKKKTREGVAQECKVEQQRREKTARPDTKQNPPSPIVSVRRRLTVFPEPDPAITESAFRQMFDEIDAGLEDGTMTVAKCPHYVQNAIMKDITWDTYASQTFSTLLKERIPNWVVNETGMNLIELFAYYRDNRPHMIEAIASILPHLTGRKGEGILGLMLTSLTATQFANLCLKGDLSSVFVSLFHSSTLTAEQSVKIALRIAKGVCPIIREFVIKFGRSIAETDKGRLFVESLAKPRPEGCDWQEMFKFLSPITLPATPSMPSHSTIATLGSTVGRPATTSNEEKPSTSSLVDSKSSFNFRSKPFHSSPLFVASPPVGASPSFQSPLIGTSSIGRPSFPTRTPIESKQTTRFPSLSTTITERIVQETVEMMVQTISKKL